MGLSVDRKRALSPEQQKLFDSGLALAKQRTRWWSYVCRGDFHEVYSWALVGLMQAALKYEPGAATFATYAAHRIRGAILDGIRNERGVGKSDRPETMRARTAAAGLLGYDDDELVVLDQAPGAEEQLIELQEQMRGRLREDLNAALDSLPSRERHLLRGHYFEGRKYMDMAPEVGLSRSQVSRVKDRGLKMMREALGAK